MIARGKRAGGYLLLEVVMSMALLLLGLAFIGGQIQKAQESSYDSEDLTRVMMLAESKIAELDTGLVYFDEEADDEVEGDFTLRFPDYGWRMTVRETATEGMRAITLHILHAVRETLEEEFDFEGAKVVYTVHTMRADPPILDVQTDLGMDEEMINSLKETLPGEYFDPPYFDPRVLPELEFDELVEILPQLMSLFGDNADALLASLPPEFRAMLDQETGEPLAETQQGGTTTRGGQPIQLSDEDLGAFGMTREEFDQMRQNQGTSGGGRQQAPRGNRLDRGGRQSGGGQQTQRPSDSRGKGGGR